MPYPWAYLGTYRPRVYGSYPYTYGPSAAVSILSELYGVVKKKSNDTAAVRADTTPARRPPIVAPKRMNNTRTRTMFAVIKTGGRQYRVVPDDVLEVGKIEGEVGTIVQLDDQAAEGYHCGTDHASDCPQELLLSKIFARRQFSYLW